MSMVSVIFKSGVLAAGLLSTVVALAAPPEWINGNPKMYPNEMYLIGRGVGSTAEEAQNRARGDLATIFEVRVEVLTASTTTVAKSGNKEQVDRQAVNKYRQKPTR